MADLRKLSLAIRALVPRGDGLHGGVFRRVRKRGDHLRPASVASQSRHERRFVEPLALEFEVHASAVGTRRYAICPIDWRGSVAYDDASTCWAEVGRAAVGFIVSADVAMEMPAWCRVHSPHYRSVIASIALYDVWMPVRVDESEAHDLRPSSERKPAHVFFEYLLHRLRILLSPKPQYMAFRARAQHRAGIAEGRMPKCVFFLYVSPYDIMGR